MALDVTTRSAEHERLLALAAETMPGGSLGVLPPAGRGPARRPRGARQQALRRRRPRVRRLHPRVRADADRARPPGRCRGGDGPDRARHDLLPADRADDSARRAGLRRSPAPTRSGSSAPATRRSRSPCGSPAPSPAATRSSSSRAAFTASGITPSTRSSPKGDADFPRPTPSRPASRRCSTRRCWSRRSTTSRRQGGSSPSTPASLPPSSSSRSSARSCRSRGFLQGVRQVTRDHGIPMMLDEVVTGFRLAWGGAQEYYEVECDLASYGKAVSGGYPLAASPAAPTSWRSATRVAPRTRTTSRSAARSPATRSRRQPASRPWPCWSSRAPTTGSAPSASSLRAGWSRSGRRVGLPLQAPGEHAVFQPLISEHEVTDAAHTREAGRRERRTRSGWS